MAIALIIGAVELISIAADKLSIATGPIAWIGGLDLNYVGHVIVGLFGGNWVVALAVWRFGRIEERRSRGLRPAEAAD